MGKTAFLFPGQGSQAVGMGQAFMEAYSVSKDVFTEADNRLDYELTKLIMNGPIETLTRTENTQPALVTASVAVLEALREKGITADYTAGHSLGEYSALVASGALSFSDAVFAVRNRGLYMEEAVPSGEGAMAAIMGMEREALQQVVDDVSASTATVQLANLNSPGQIVISGAKEGVEKASEVAKEKGARRVIPLQVSGPFHSSLMKPAADKLSSILEGIEIKDASIPVIANVTAEPSTSAEEIHDHLLKQIYSPVLWEDTVRKLMDLGVDTFIEVGPGNVLSGLVKKVNRRASVHAVSTPEQLDQLIEKLGEE
ncbi:ACP S-malonyltransferase [Bacillus sp. NTK071]|uniref:Malonyl CoA-acyl carrier protein transacylase n=1 Tax=Guptibacillus hwajinpoensis TaxID=208199 RepID=A0A4U1MM96_9BACL|nr:MULTISPECIES: ACP S-malonyltransferase [Bacillaceae]MBN8207442.1 ACP S-malonyltransferase [Bacillus sp. NTK071]TKD71692.1 ACP S-malonyltransferase [Pseudalkalibacillus hwajinpoensis]